MRYKSCLDIDRIAFFGRTYSEYMDMFGLDDELLRRGPILDCPAGASSFTAEALKKGLDVTAGDLMYGRTVGELLEKGREDIRHVFEKFDEAEHLYVWEYYKNKNEVMALRNKALEIFTGDYADGFEKRCYMHAELPHLPFPDKKFSLVLSGNFLFLYGDRLSVDFHKACLKELVRVCAGEIRIFPLTGLDAKPCLYMDEILSFLREYGISAEIEKVSFEFQRGADKILKLKFK